MGDLTYRTSIDHGLNGREARSSSRSDIVLAREADLHVEVAGPGHSRAARPDRVEGHVVCQRSVRVVQARVSESYRCGRCRRVFDGALAAFAHGQLQVCNPPVR